MYKATYNFFFFNRNRIYIGLSVIIFFILLSFALGHAKETYQFLSVNDIKQFTIYNSKSDIIKDKGLKISQINNTAVLFNTHNFLSTISWQNSPYIKLYIDPIDSDRIIELIWSPTKNLKNLYRRSVNIPKNTDNVIINTHQNLAWQRIIPWKNDIYGNTSINAFGLLISEKYNNFIITKIELLSTLNIIDYTKLLFHELITDEGVRVNSINAQYGISVLGSHLASILGVILILGSVPLLINFNHKNLRIFIIISGVCFMIYFIPSLTTLINHSIDSSKISAFHKDKYTEYSSRFGKQFANLSQKLETLVPKKSKVHFAPSRDYRVNGESNWIAFQYYGIYDISNIKEANYIFYYHPRYLTFDIDNNLIVMGEETYKVKILIQIENNYILEKIYE